jgi:glycosyltransferase involved in cell wall biosynthesis
MTTQTPDISIVVPCYNEEAIIGYTVPKLVAAFQKAGYRPELVAVDNGSSDGTGRIIGEFVAAGLPVVPHRVEVNRGYGFGVLCGISRCSAPWVCLIPADGQVDAEDVVRIYESVLPSDGLVVAKARRRFRMDGLMRKVVSTSYNVFIRMLWPSLCSIDINGTPKIIRRDVLGAMQLRSHDWFLDPEIMLKAHQMGLRVLEVNVFARMRGNGLSHVKPGTCWEFFWNILCFRFSHHHAQNHSVHQVGMEGL